MITNEDDDNKYGLIDFKFNDQNDSNTQDNDNYKYKISNNRNNNFHKKNNDLAGYAVGLDDSNLIFNKSNLERLEELDHSKSFNNKDRKNKNKNEFIHINSNSYDWNTIDFNNKSFTKFSPLKNNLIDVNDELENYKGRTNRRVKSLYNPYDLRILPPPTFDQNKFKMDKLMKKTNKLLDISDFKNYKLS